MEKKQEQEEQQNVREASQLPGNPLLDNPTSSRRIQEFAYVPKAHEGSSQQQYVATKAHHVSPLQFTSTAQELPKEEQYHPHHPPPRVQYEGTQALRSISPPREFKEWRVFELPKEEQYSNHPPARAQKKQEQEEQQNVREASRRVQEYAYMPEANRGSSRQQAELPQAVQYPYHPPPTAQDTGIADDTYIRFSSVKVPHQIRQANENAYEPQLISIGPFHRGKPHLEEMEVYKKGLLRTILAKGGPNRLDRFLKATIKHLDQVHQIWWPTKLQYQAAEMLFDGCFIVMLLCGMARKTNPIFKLQWVQYTLYHDLLLLENQYPLLVLEDVYRWFVSEGLYRPEDGKDDFASLALLELSKVVPGPKVWVNKRNPNIKLDTHNIVHLLNLVHNNWSPSPQGIERHKLYQDGKKTETAIEGEESIEEGGQDKWKFTLFAVEKAKGKKIQVDEELGLTETTAHNYLSWKITCCRKEKKKVRRGLVEWQSIRSVTELEEAGIKFLKCTHSHRSNVESLFDISFTDATMEIPTFVIDDYTERLFRNFMAWELHEEGSTYVIDYVTLMDNLINSAEDVQLLRFSGVIENMLGDEEAVAQMINKLRDHVTLCGDTFYYEEIFVGLKKHCARRWNIWKAKLRSDYFNSPWTFISFLAALLIILLTIGGFVTGVLQITISK